MKYEVYEVPNDELDDTEEFIVDFTTRIEALDYAAEERGNAGCSIWVIMASDDGGYIRVIST